MLPYYHQLVTTDVCLQFAAEQVVHGDFFFQRKRHFSRWHQAGCLFGSNIKPGCKIDCHWILQAGPLMMKLTTAAALNNVSVSLIRLCRDIKDTEESFTENLSNDVISKIKLLSRAGRWLYLHLSTFVLSLTHTHTHTHTQCQQEQLSEYSI